MAVAPDILLSPTPAPSPRATPSKAAQDSANATNDKGSSFADVYAQESRPASTERPANSAKPARDKGKPQQDKDTTDSASAPPPAADQPKVAEGGKALPADGQDKPASADDKPADSLDPLLALGLGSPLPASAASASTAPAATGQSQPGAAASDGDLLKLNQAQGVNLLSVAGAPDATPALQLQLQAQVQGVGQAQGQADTATAAKLVDKLGDGHAKTDMASLLAGLSSGQELQSADGKALDTSLQASAELAQQLPEKAVDSKSENRNEAFANKLEALTQALNGTQQSLTSRPVNALVPGQPVSVQQSGWTDAVVDRVMWMSSQNLKSADIQMEPADLGRVEVRIHMASDQTQVTFASANAGVREALESQQHRLRDMFSQQGMNQVNVNVSDQSLARGWQGQQQGGNARGGGNAATGRDAADDEPLISGVSEIRSRPQVGGLGMVDYYA
ncbi:flagellar hook-length control protein FliK [Pseudomonas panipatensis]|uniref:Flagellar hook-length control protein FliK n=1 Tax=Pseudomonas panipatensis TaxID=428992 RepID=A0A1G8GCR0_9PSED|nr:flagellar hook-length control protein FliK [Pseudomonas panipatensis]SDH92081.1 flagellar hook-length control protein FliK [Pseudomonas panipatensis]SMP44238.1 flagellar hook-length control protein FliK [Pseudomonas panipatensis]